jgi:Ca2+-binding EF-hand superfamily protein
VPEPEQAVKPARTLPTNADYMRQGVSPQQLQELREVFDLFDSDGSGGIDSRELKSAMTSLGFTDVSKANVAKLMADIDKDEDGRVDFAEFLHMMTSKISERQPGDDMFKAFQLMDIHGTGEPSATAQQCASRSAPMPRANALL